MRVVVYIFVRTGKPNPGSFALFAFITDFHPFPKSSVYVNQQVPCAEYHGRAVLVAGANGCRGPVSAGRTQPSSASPTGLLLSATVPGVLTGVVPAESLHCGEAGCSGRSTSRLCAGGPGRAAGTRRELANAGRPEHR